MDVVFTIVAKNYLALAKTLMKSVATYGPSDGSLKLFVFVADEFEEEQIFSIPDCEIMEAKQLSIEGYYNLAFKYDITEFCTALKPFCMDYLATVKKAERVIYFDPDICLFNSLSILFDSLDQKLCLLTPHYMTPEVQYSGVVPEEMILWAGILNLGFIAVNTTNQHYRRFIDWWKNRLYFKCYADKQDGLHTDQKWIDFVPSFFPNDTIISNHMGMNASVWNLHERKVECKNGQYTVSSPYRKTEDPLVFFHFSGFDLNDKTLIHKHHPALSLLDRPEMTPIMDFYRAALIQNGFNETIKWKYSYATYKNNKAISWFQRRIFRRLIDGGEKLGNPFEVGKGSYYDHLLSNRMVSDMNVTDSLKANHINQHQGKVKMMFHVYKLLKRVLGIDKYTLLLKFLFRYARPENQVFLLKEYDGKFDFYNENRIESTDPNKKSENR